MCIFVVDDDRAVRDALKFTLGLEGLDVRACAGGVELLEHPDLGRAGCIVLDRRMPEMDGFAVVGELATRAVRAPVILIVSDLTADVRRLAALGGINHILEKPLVGNALPDLIHKVMQEARA